MRSFSPFVLFLILCGLPSIIGYAQEPIRYPNPAENLVQTPQIDAPRTVLDVRIEGNVQVPTADILRIIQIRPGRPFSETILEEDKRALMQRTWFVDVRPRVDRTPDGGYIVTFHCIERQLIHFIRITGNKVHTKNTLLEEANIKVGDALDPIAIRQAAERIAQFYRESGYHKAHVEILGGEFGDRGVIFKINEGPRQRILSVEFEGNRIASSQRLKTLIQTKPGFFFWLNSDFTRKGLDDDVETLTNYYRKLGFFYAKIDRVFEEGTFYGGFGQPRGWIRVSTSLKKVLDVKFGIFDSSAIMFLAMKRSSVR